MEKVKAISYDAADTPQMTVAYKKEILFALGHILYRYDVESGKLAQIKLSHENAFNLQRRGKYLYIGYTDIWNGEESWLGIYDLEQNREVHTEHFDYQID